MEAAFGDGDPAVVGNMERGPEAASAFRRERLTSVLAAVPLRVTALTSISPPLPPTALS